MTSKACRKSGRKHTPITSEAQKGLIGADYQRVKEGKEPRTKGMTQAERNRHLFEARGKTLPKRVKPKK